jgi:tRNA nucleotidyltransferase/poly(A) polymerase
MGRAPRDFDIIVNKTPDNLEKTLREKFRKVVKNGKGNKNSWAITTDSELEIDFICAQDAKPDFTFNGMKWHPDIKKINPDGSYSTPGNEVIDPRNGRQDIAEEKLRFYEPAGESFVQNMPLIFRVRRFEREFNYTLDVLVIACIARDQIEIEQIPYRIEKEKLEEHYTKMLKAFDNNTVELHKVLNKDRLFDGMKIKGIIKADSVSEDLNDKQVAPATFRS